MTSLLTSLYLLSFKETEISHNVGIDCIKVYNKNKCVQGLYSEEKNDFFESRTGKFKKNWGWKKNVKAVNKLLRSYKSILLSWESNQPLKIFFSNGTIVNLELNNDNNTLDKIEIYNNLIGKFIPSRIVDAVLTQSNIYVTYCEPKLTLIHFNQESSSLPARMFGIKGKLIGSEPKISHIDLIGPCSKSVERKLSLNSTEDHLLVWWKFSGDDVWPWTPLTYSADRVNMVVYTLNDGFDVLCTVKSYGELIQANYSKQYSNQILTIEKAKNEPENSINVCVYEIIGNQCHHAFYSKLPLRGNLLSCDWSSNDKLLISDSDNVLLIYDLKKKTSIVTNLLFLPKQIAWHPQNCIAIVVGSDNQLQCFDAALTCVKFQMSYGSYPEHDILNIKSYFSHCGFIQNMLWQKSSRQNSCMFLLDSDLSSILILNFCSGIISQNSLGTFEFTSQYLKSNLIDEAILLLRSLSWHNESELSFQCLSKIANCLLRKSLNSKNQAGLELALGTFYDNIDNLPKCIIKNYEHKLHHLARRFFHHLLRHFEFRKAYLLAVDLESQDLFLDLYHIATQKGENHLAMVALHKADEFETSSYSCTPTSSSYNSDSDTSSDIDVNNMNSRYQGIPYKTYDMSSHHQFQLSDTRQSQLVECWLDPNGPGDISHNQASFSQSTSMINEPVYRNPVFSRNSLSSENYHENNFQTSSTSNTRLLPESVTYSSSYLPEFDKVNSSANIIYPQSESIRQIHMGQSSTFDTNSVSMYKNSVNYSSTSARPLPELLSQNLRITSKCSNVKRNANHFHIKRSEESISVNPKSSISEDKCSKLGTNSVSMSKNSVKIYSSSSIRPLPELPSHNLKITSDCPTAKRNDNHFQIKLSEGNVSITPKIKISEDECEELDDPRIKLVHFGII